MRQIAREHLIEGYDTMSRDELDKVFSYIRINLACPSEETLREYARENNVKGCEKLDKINIIKGITSYDESMKDIMTDKNLKA